MNALVELLRGKLSAEARAGGLDDLAAKLDQAARELIKIAKPMLVLPETKESDSDESE